MHCQVAHPTTLQHAPHTYRLLWLPNGANRKCVSPNQRLLIKQHYSLNELVLSVLTTYGADQGRADTKKRPFAWYAICCYQDAESTLVWRRVRLYRIKWWRCCTAECITETQSFMPNILLRHRKSRTCSLLNFVNTTSSSETSIADARISFSAIQLRRHHTRLLQHPHLLSASALGPKTQLLSEPGDTNATHRWSTSV